MGSWAATPRNTFILSFVGDYLRNCPIVVLVLRHACPESKVQQDRAARIGRRAQSSATCLTASIIAWQSLDLRHMRKLRQFGDPHTHQQSPPGPCLLSSIFCCPFSDNFRCWLASADCKNGAPQQEPSIRPPLQLENTFHTRIQPYQGLCSLDFLDSKKRRPIISSPKERPRHELSVFARFPGAFRSDAPH